MKVTDIRAREIINSRAVPTLEVEVKVGERWYRASVPQGKSRGLHEAFELRDKHRIFGLGVESAVKKVFELREHIVGRDVEEWKEIEKELIMLDGTPNKSRLGGNVILGVGMALIKAYAGSLEAPLWEVISQELGFRPGLPAPMMNIINGGKHAGNELAIQEFMEVPPGKSFREKLLNGVMVYLRLKEIIEKKFGKAGINVGDEGGFAPPLSKSSEALDLLVESFESLEIEPAIALDCAASSYFREGKYLIDGKELERREYVEYLLEIVSSYPIISVEDPMFEEDFEGFSEFLSKFGKIVVGDDLLVTNVSRLKKAMELNSVNAVLVKPNQVGSVTETFEFIKLAKENGLKVIVSHRSGETEDVFISHLAVGVGADFIKAGAPARGERTCKYNELLRIEEVMA